MIELTKLVAYYIGRIQKPPLPSALDQHEVILSTLAYLNSYRVTSVMLRTLAQAHADLTTKGEPT